MLQPSLPGFCHLQYPNHRDNQLNQDLRGASFYSPIFDAVDLNLSVQTIKGSRDNSSFMFQGPPSPELDEAWGKIYMHGAEGFLASSSELIRSGIDPSLVIKATGAWGGGPDSYVVEIDGFHHLHCLDNLRKHIHADHYFPHGLDSHAIEHRDHCLDMLRQLLMCNFDVGLIPVYWVWSESRGEAIPKENFSTHKKCRDHGALLEWAYEHALPDFPQKWRHLEPQEGETVLEQLPPY